MILVRSLLISSALFAIGPVAIAQGLLCNLVGQGCETASDTAQFSDEWQSDEYALVPEQPVVEPEQEPVADPQIIYVPVERIIEKRVEVPVPIVATQPIVQEQPYQRKPLLIMGATPSRPVVTQSADPTLVPSQATKLDSDLSRILPPFSRLIGKTDSTISSSTQGSFTIMIDRPVYGYSGQEVLVPVGSRLVCQHQGIANNSLARIAATCRELYTPDGRVALLKDAPVGGADGAIGPFGHRDDRYLQRYGPTLAMSALRYTTDTVTRTQETTTPEEEQTRQLTQDWATELSKITDDMFEDNQELGAVVVVPAGSIVVLQPLSRIEFE